MSYYDQQVLKTQQNIARELSRLRAIEEYKLKIGTRMLGTQVLVESNDGHIVHRSSRDSERP